MTSVDGNSKLRRSIAGRLLFWFLVIALIPCAIVTAITARIAATALEKSVRDNLVQIAAGKANELESYASERVRDCAAFARGPTFTQAIRKLAAVPGDDFASGNADIDCDLSQPLPHPVAELRGGVSRVGRDEDRADPHALVSGDRLRDDRRDGIGLPRAGAGLDERAVGKQAFRESEGCGHVRVYFIPLLVSLSRAMKRSRNASSRDAGAKICPKPGLSP